MVRERYDDLDLGSVGYEIDGWRCLNCGAIVDPVIAAHIKPLTRPSQISCGDDD
jgi:hypothetical protein